MIVFNVILIPILGFWNCTWQQKCGGLYITKWKNASAAFP
jgi:hypothetical protein